MLLDFFLSSLEIVAHRTRAKVTWLVFFTLLGVTGGVEACSARTREPEAQPERPLTCRVARRPGSSFTGSEGSLASAYRPHFAEAQTLDCPLPLARVLVAGGGGMRISAQSGLS